MFQFSRNLVWVMVFSVFLCTQSQALDLMPKLGGGGSGPSPNGLVYAYWLMSEGSAVGYKVKVNINGQNITSIKKPGETLEITNYLKLGLNTVKFIASDERRQPSGASANSVLNIIIGPEYKRTPVGGFGGYSIELREKTLHYLRPMTYRAADNTVDMRFTLSDDPNPSKLQKKYVLYADGRFTGHLIQVNINGVPVVDVMSPEFHCDLNPFLAKGPNEITFTSVPLEGYPFTASDRAIFKEDDGLEVGIGEAGDFDPVTFTEPVRQVTKTSQRYIQSGHVDQAEQRETFNFMAE
jgi:hypothetical protein